MRRFWKWIILFPGLKAELLEKDSSIKGFEVTTNAGMEADYSGHCRVHLVPIEGWTKKHMKEDTGKRRIYFI